MSSDPKIQAFKAIKRTLENVTFPGIPAALDRVRGILDGLNGPAASSPVESKSRGERTSRNRIDRTSPDRSE